MTVLESNNKHALETREALERFKKLADSMDGWELAQELDKVKIYSMKPKEPSAPVMVRGDTVITDLPAGCLPLDLMTAATLRGCRKIWDDKFDDATVNEIYTRDEFFFWVKQKAPWPISPRDFVGTLIQENQTDATYCSLTSVRDDRFPPASGTVRGALLVSGWKFYYTSDKKIAITYINQADLSGSLPTSFMKKMFLQIPLFAGKVRDYISKYGFVPSLRFVETGVEFKGESFDHDSRKYTTELSAQQQMKGKSAEIVCCARMYPKGVQVQLKGGQGKVEQSVDENKNHHIVLNDLKGSQISVVITKKK